MGCAATDDVTAWCLLAFVVSVVEARTAGALSTVVTALVFIAAMVVVVRPAMVRLTFLYGNRGLTQGMMAAVFVALLLSALTTDYIGIHAIFGAFALGAIIPHDSSLARELTDRLEDLVVVLLLPAFFAFTGLRNTNNQRVFQLEFGAIERVNRRRGQRNRNAGGDFQQVTTK